MIEIRAMRENGNIVVSGSMSGSSGDVIDELAVVCATILDELNQRYEGEDDILSMLSEELVRGIAAQLRGIAGEAD